MIAIINCLTTIISLLKRLNSQSQYVYLEYKSVWTIEELCAYTGFERSYIHKLTSARQIPFFKPTGRTIFFDSTTIKEWLKTNPTEEIESALADVFTDKKIR